jgi:16S rRNA C1402 (ribose-2'-O) methylase RsmI
MFNEKYREGQILSALAGGRNVALISDAGTPCVSDPGGIIVKAAAGRGFRVVPVCGASAVTAALSVCGFEFTSFAFFGFMPRTKNGMTKLIESVKGVSIGVSVFFESPRRIFKSLDILASIAPRAEICLCNDLTKKYERIYRGKPGGLAAELAANPSAEKGEYTLVCRFAEGVGGGTGSGGIGVIAGGGGVDSSVEDCDGDNTFNDAGADEGDNTFDGASAVDCGNADGGGRAAASNSFPDLSAEALIADYMVKNGGTAKDAIGRLSERYGYKKKDLYDAAINLKRIFFDGQGGRQPRL